MKTVEEVADKMYGMMEIFGEGVDKKTCKAAVAHLNSSGRCTYSMYGGVNYLEIVE